jgi:hypothetical protein
MARRRRGAASRTYRCRGVRTWTGRRCGFRLTPPHVYCAWHAGQAATTIAPLPALHDGSLSFAQLRRWAIEFDGLSPERWPAADFLEWVAAEPALSAAS